MLEDWQGPCVIYYACNAQQADTNDTPTHINTNTNTHGGLAEGLVDAEGLLLDGDGGQRSEAERRKSTMLCANENQGAEPGLVNFGSQRARQKRKKFPALL